MATKKKATASKKSKKPAGGAAKAAKAPENKLYNECLKEFTNAVKTLHKGDYAAARKIFATIQSKIPEETGLVDRAGSYIRICDEKMAAPVEVPTTPDGLYYLGVMRANEDRLDEAMGHINTALQAEPDSPSILYARAMVLARQGNAEAAVADLRQAIAINPLIRFQLINDSDFEQIRDEATFIDLIEPTPSGA